MLPIAIVASHSFVTADDHRRLAAAYHTPSAPRLRAAVRARTSVRAYVCCVCQRVCRLARRACRGLVSSRACDARVIASEREGLHCTSHSSAVSSLHLVRSSPAQPTTLRSGCRLVEDRLTTTPPHTSEPVACRVLRVRVCLLIFWRGAASESSRANVWLCECVLACVRV